MENDKEFQPKAVLSNSKLPTSLNDFVKISSEFTRQSDQFAQKSKDIARAYHESIKHMGHLEAEIYDLRTQIETLNERKSEDDTRWTMIEKENDVLRESLSSTKAEAKKWETQIHDLAHAEESLNELKSENNDLTKSLNTLMAQQEEKEEEIAQLRKKAKALAQDHEYSQFLKKENDDLRNTLDMVRLESNENIQKITALEEKITEMNQDFRRETQEFKQEEKEKDQKLLKFETDLNRHRRYHRRILQYVRPLISDVSQNNTNLRKRISDFDELLKNRLSQKTKTIDYCKEKNQLAITEIKNLNQQVAKLKENLSMALKSRKDGLATLEVEREEGAQARARMVEEKNTALSSLQRMTVEFKKLKESYTKQSTTNRHLKERVQILEKESQKPLKRKNFPDTPLGEMEFMKLNQSDYKFLNDKKLPDPDLPNSSSNRSLEGNLEQNSGQNKMAPSSPNSTFREKLHDRLQDLASDMKEISEQME